MKIRRILAAVLTAAVIVGSIPVSELSVFAQEIGQVETGTEIEAEVETNTEIEAEVETNKEVKIGTEDDAGVDVFSIEEDGIEEDGIEDSDVTDKNVAVETEEVIENESDSNYNLLDDSQFDASLMLTGNSDYESAHFVAYYHGKLIASEDVKKGEYFRYKSGSYIAITGLGSQSEGNTGTLDTNYVCVSINENGGSEYRTLYGSGYCWHDDDQELFSLGDRNIESVQIEAAQLETSKIACVSNIPECNITYSVADKVGDYVKIDNSKEGQVRVNIGIPEGYEFTSGTFDATFGGTDIEGYQLCSHAKLFVDNNTNEYYCVLDFESLARLAHIVDDWPNDKFNINATVAQKEEEGVHSNYTVNCSDEYGDKHYKLLPAQFGSNIVKDSNDNNYYIVNPEKPIKVVLTPEQYYVRKDAPYVFVGNDRVDVDWNSYWYYTKDQLNSEFTINNMNFEDGGYIIIPFDGNVRITDGSETDGNEDGYIPTIVEPASSDYWFSADNETLGKYGNWSYCVESTTFYDGAGNQVLTPSFELRQNGDHGKLSDVTLGSTVKFKIKMKPGMVLNSVTRVWYEDKEGKRYGDSDYKRYHGDVLKADENGIYSFEANASYTWIYINAEPEGNYCDDGKVKLTIEPSGFTKVTMTEVIGTRNCTLKLHRRGTHYDLGEWTYNFKNSNPGNVMWIFVDPDKKSWYSKWTYQGIVEYSGTYYVTLETQGKVYRSADFVYTKPENKLDAPNPDSFYVEERNESGWGRYLHWDDINNDKCAGYEFEAKSAENGKSSNFMMFYPNAGSGYCLDNMYNALGTGKWTIRIRAISNDINEVTVGDWTEYEYTMTKRVPATSVTLSDTSMSLYMEGDDSSAVITAVVDPAETVTLTGVSWKSSNEKVAKIEQIGNNKVKVTAVGLGTAKIVATTFDSANKSASCTVTVRQSRPVVSFTGINSGIRLYTPGVNNALGQLGEVLSADENGNVCLNSDYEETICFAPIPTDDNHEIDTVKVGTKALLAVKGKYEDNGVTKDITYYKLSKITRSQTVNITQKPRAMTTDDYFELDQSNAQNRKFATSVATAGENGKYYFKKDTRNLTFTVTSDIAHVPVVSIGYRGDDDGFVADETLHGTLKTDDKYTKRIYTYEIEAFKTSGKVIQITDQDAPKKQLRVEVQPAAVLEPVVKIGADTKTFEEESKPEAGIYLYSIPEFSTVAVSYAFKEGKSDSYKLTGITVNEKAQATNKGTVSTVVADDSDVQFTATGITTMFLTKGDDPEIIFNNGVATLGSRDTATLQIRNGDSTEEPLALSSNSEIACVVKAGGKDVPGFATVSDDKKTVTIDAKTAAILNKNPVTVTLQGDDFAKQTIKFNVDQLVSGITAKKFDKSTQQNKATQNAGTVATYALTFAPKGAPLDNICIKYVNGSDENGQVFLATESNGSMVLSVETFKDNEIATNPLMVQFYDNAGNDDPSDDIKIGLPFVITPSAKFAAPTVKLVSATDIGMKLSLKAPKGLEQYKNLYYEISATPKSPISDKMMAEELVVHEPINAMETELILAKGTENSNSPILGDGAAQKYDVTVKIVQVIENKENIDEVIFNSDNIFTPQAGAIKKITASTKAPYYETNLTLKGKKATFTQGETTPGFERSGLYVAMAKFSSATTFASVDPEKSYVAGADGKKIDGADILVGPDGVSIWISDTSVIPVGKATLVVAPLAPEGAQYKNATLALKVKAPIDKISLTQKGAMSSGNGIKLFKKQGTAAKIKFTATPLWDGDDSNSDSWFNPASTKVEWTLTAPSGSPLLDNKNATIDKSGTVTISEDYICNNTELDKFTVTAKAADFTGNTVSASREVTLTSKAIELVSAKVVKEVDGQPDEEVDVSSASPKDLIGKTLKFYDKDGNWIKPINLVYKVKPAGIGFDSKGKIVSVSKAGSFTVTATSLDGGKSSLATTITNAGLTIGSAKVFVWEDEEDNYKEVTDYDTVDSSTFGYISFYDEEGNAIKCSDLDIKASTGLTLTINSPDSDKAFITAVKQSGTYNVTATTKDGGDKKLVKDITFTGTTEGYEVTKLTYSSGSNNTNVFETIPKLLDNPSVQEATVSNANAICLDVFRTDSGVYPYNAKVTVSGGSIITKTVGTIWDDDGKVRQGGKYVIKPKEDVVGIIVNGGGKKAVYKINVISGKGKALKANKLTKTEFIGATTASYDTSFTFETSEFKADDSKEYRLVFTPNEAYHKVKTDKERSAYDTLAALLEEAGNEVETTSIKPTSGAVFKTKTLKDYGSVPVGSYKFDVTAVQVIRDNENNIIELKPLTKPLTVTFKAKAPKAISAKLNNSGKVTIDDTESVSAQIPFVSNSAYSSIINTETVKPILYNNNNKGVISSFKKYFDVTVSGDKLILTRKSGEDAKYNWTEAEKKKGNTAIVGWVEYTVVGQDGITKRTYCEKVTATLKYKGN